MGVPYRDLANKFLNGGRNEAFEFKGSKGFMITIDIESTDVK